MFDWKKEFPNFSREELTCKCGCGLMPLEEFIAKLQKLRNVADFPFIITSGARCPEYNNKVSATGYRGPHTYQRAVDIAVYGSKAVRLVRLALIHGFTGIGVSQKGEHKRRFIHLDDLDNTTPNTSRPWIWSY